MIGWILLDAATAGTASSTSPTLAMISGVTAAVIALINTVGLVLVARKKSAPPKATEDLGGIRNDLKTQGSALAELRALVAEIEARGPGANPAQVKAAMARIGAIEKWCEARDASDEQRRVIENEQNVKLGTILENLKWLERWVHDKEDRDGRRSRG